jgi:methylisocitrate lyase
VFNGLTALLATRAGAEALYLSGAALSASMGLPDLGLLTLEEVVRAVGQIVRVTDRPLIVDADTGFGGPLAVMRAVRDLEDAGASAIQIEDQQDPKRCGHLDGKRVIEPVRMQEKVAAATAARREMLVIARTDARATEGPDGAIRRGLAYREAGADVIFPEALVSEDEFAAFARSVPGPLLANMTEFGKGPLLSVRRLGELGYRLVIFPVSAARVAAQQVKAFYAELLRDGEQTGWLDRMLTRQQLYELTDHDAYVELDRSLARDDP